MRGHVPVASRDEIHSATAPPASPVATPLTRPPLVASTTPAADAKRIDRFLSDVDVVLAREGTAGTTRQSCPAPGFVAWPTSSRNRRPNGFAPLSSAGRNPRHAYRPHKT